MALDYEVPKDKRVLYWLGDKLIDYRHPVMIVVLIITGVAFVALALLILVPSRYGVTYGVTYGDDPATQSAE